MLRKIIRVYQHRFCSINLNTNQICSVCQVLQTDGNTTVQYLRFQVFIYDGNTLLNSERVCSGS
jgi:hypothetical protein